MTQRKIAFIAHGFQHGGAQKYLYDFVRYCCGEAIECMVIGPRSGPQLHDFRDLGVEVIPIPMTSVWGSSVLLRPVQFLKIIVNTLQMIKALLRFQPTLVYTNTSTIISGAFASKILRLPHFWHVHENFDTMEIPVAIPRKALPMIMESMSVKVIFVSHLAMKSIFPNGSSKAVVVHNGVDLSRFMFSNRSVTKVNKPCICFIGALAHRKGVDILLLALALLKHENGRAPCLDIWGSGDPGYTRLLKNLADELGIADRVRFMGHTSNIDEILPEYDVLVVPSRGESFSLVALEGMAAGVPVVATRCGGPEEIIDDGTSGHLVDVGDYRHMARAITRILDDPAHAKRLAKEAHNKAVYSFDIKRQFKTIRQLVLSWPVSEYSR